VKIAFGTDMGVGPHGDNAREFIYMVEAGIPAAYALQAATILAAEVLGVDDQGVVEAGKRADIIAMPGDPLADIGNGDESRLRDEGRRGLPDATAMNLEWLGFLAAACTTLSFVPQAAKTIRTRDTSGISLWMYVVFTFGIACWFGYGVYLMSWPMILSNAVTFVLSSTILGMKLKYG
jgi:MtN3 and saliva related transmembrane protein